MNAARSTPDRRPTAGECRPGKVSDPSSESQRLEAANGGRKARILFVDHAAGIGGAERNLLLLIRYLDPECWSPLLACPDGSFARQAAAQGIPLVSAHLPRLWSSPRFPLDWFLGARSITRAIRQAHVDLVVANTVRSAFYCMLAARLVKVPFIWYMQDFWLTETRPRRAFGDALGKSSLYRSASLVLANSFATARHLPCSRKVEVVHPGIDIQSFQPDPENALEFRNRYHIPQQAQLVGMVARMRPWKGQERFLGVAARVRSQLPETRFVLVGGDPFQIGDQHRQKMEQLASELGIRASTTFTGHLDDVRPALAAMDVFVHPGDPEPFGIVNIEAMAIGNPVVAFDHGALPEIVEHGKTGFLIPPGDLDRLAGAVLELLGSSRQRADMGQRGRARAAQRFTIRRSAARVSELFESVLL